MRYFTMGIKHGYFLFYLTASALILSAGCQDAADMKAKSLDSATGFEVRQVRLQPSFTTLNKTQSDQAQPDRIDAYVQLKDQFDDPIKATGRFRFEIFHYRPAFSDPRGKRLESEGIQLIDLSDININQKHWDSISRSYYFKLPLPQEAAILKKIVLQVTYIKEDDYRLRDILIIE